LLTVVVVSLLLWGGGVNAQQVVPRYLPDPVGFQSTGAGDYRPGPGIRDAYNVILRSSKRDREVTVRGVPSNKAEADFLLIEQANYFKAKKVAISGEPGILYSRGSVLWIDWVVRNKVRVTVQAAGLSRSEALALAAGVSVSKKNDGGFTLKRKPSGLSTIFTAWASSFGDGGYLATWQRPESKAEMRFDVQPTVPNYLDVFCGPSNGRRLTTELINGKPGCFEDRPLWDPGVFWMPEPNVVIRLNFADYGEAELLKLASTVVRVDEVTYQQRTTPPPK
jgi:hypothetical protein